MVSLLISISLVQNYQDFSVEDKRSIHRSPLAKKIFETNGVKNVFFGKDFISVTKKKEDTWKVLKTLVFSSILDHIASGEPNILDHVPVSDTQVLDDDSEVTLGLLCTFNLC